MTTSAGSTSHRPTFGHFTQPRTALLALVAVFAIASGLAASASLLSASGVILGRVVDASGAPVPKAGVLLRNSITGRELSGIADTDGRFFFFNVPANPYHLHVIASGFATLERDIDVHAGAPLELLLTLRGAVAATVEVSDERLAVLLDTDTSVKHIDIDRSLIERAPSAATSRGLEALVLQTPGFIADENGRFHFQGSHGQITYVVDGAPISDQIHATFSNSLDPNQVESIEVISGNVPAEFGNKLAAVVNLTTKSGLGFAKPFSGSVFFGASRFQTFEAGASAQGGDDSFGYFLALALSRSDRFLDPVVFENLHNEGKTGRLFGRVDLGSKDKTSFFRASLTAGGTTRDVPNLPSQEAASQSQESRTRDAMLSLGYTRFAGQTALEISGAGRLSDQRLSPSPGDTPLTFRQDRDLHNGQLLAAVSGAIGAHTWKVGGQAFVWSLQEDFSFGLTDPLYNAPDSEEYNPNLAPYDLTSGGQLFRYRDSGTPRLLSAYAQDTLRLGNLTAQLGLRLDHYRLEDPETALEPRVGLAYHIPATGTVLRASYNRLYMTPENENLLLVSSLEGASLVPPAVAEALGVRQLAVQGERQNAYEVGLEQGVFGLLKVSLSYWRRDATNLSDSFQLFNSGLLFPVTLSKGHLEGADLRIDLARTAGLSGYLSLGTAKAEATPPFNGGLFVSPEPVEVLGKGPFRIDHDQKLSAQLGLQLELAKTGVWVGTVVRYDSGLVTEIEDVAEIRGNPDLAFGLAYVDLDRSPARVKPRTVVSFSAGAELAGIGVPARLQVDLLNAFDEKGLYNFLSAFGGTHVVPPRTLAARLRVRF